MPLMLRITALLSIVITLLLAHASGGANSATISWSAVSGAASYNVYWGTTSGVTKTSGTMSSGVTSPYVKTGLSAGTTYYFIVTAVNSVGESAPSAQASATTDAPPATACGSCHAIPFTPSPPAPPAMVAATAARRPMP